MGVFGSIRQMALKVFNAIRGHDKQADFVCADCERWESCGLRPSDDCLVKVEQIARNRQSRWLRASPTQRWGLSPWDSAF